MNLQELPMVFFTVVSQMSVGTFITLGVIQLVATQRHGAATVQRVVAPVLYAIGPALVLGLVVSLFHLNDISHVFNVIRHWDSSWLSREIIFGVAFAGFGCLFALLEWFKLGSYGLRQAVAALTALLGLGLLWSESQIYYSLVTVPAWHTWAAPFQFFATAILLGVLAVGAALMVTTSVRQRRAAASAAPSSETEPSAPSGGGLATQVKQRVQEINAPTTDAEWTLTAAVLKGIAVAGAVIGIAVLAMYPLYLSELAVGGATAQQSAAVFSGGMFFLRLGLAGAVAVILGLFVYRMADAVALQKSQTLVSIVLLAFVLALVGEFLGRLMFYEAMFRIGI